MRSAFLLVSMLLVAGCISRSLPEKPRDQHAIIFRGVPVDSKLYLGEGHGQSDLFYEEPVGSGSFWLKSSVRVMHDAGPGEFYVIPGQKRFYIQVAWVDESKHRFYGPFDGRPYDIFPRPNSIRELPVVE